MVVRLGDSVNTAYDRETGLVSGTKPRDTIDRADY